MTSQKQYLSVVAQLENAVSRIRDLESDVMLKEKVIDALNAELLRLDAKAAAERSWVRIPQDEALRGVVGRIKSLHRFKEPLELPADSALFIVAHEILTLLNCRAR